MQEIEAKVAELLAIPHFSQVAHHLANGLQSTQVSAPRLASLFSTQQRWLMSHLALSHYFRSLPGGKAGISRRDFVEDVLVHGLASRNTATAFFAEAMHYGIIVPAREFPASRHVAEPAPATLSLLAQWFGLHFSALDLLDGDGRLAVLMEAGEQLVAHMHPAVASGLLSSKAIRTPSPIYAVFASVDDGGSLMDRLVASVDPAMLPGEDRLPTSITSVSTLAHALNVSRTHAGRTLASAAATGNALGWSGTRGRSPLWISREFLLEYSRIQATKLAIIEGAYRAATA